MPPRPCFCHNGHGFFTGQVPDGSQRPLVDPVNGRVVVPVTGVYATGQPWPYVYADGKP